MDGNEIITINLGPYANYVGAFLTNHEYLQTFGTVHPVNFDSDSNPNSIERDILFQPRKPLSSIMDSATAGREKSNYIPRTLFCDFEGAIPVAHANQITINSFSKTRSIQKNTRNHGYDPLMEYKDSFSSYQSYYDDDDDYSKKPKQQQKEQATITHEQLYWHNILYPHLRPMTSCPERAILTAASHVLGLAGDTLGQAKNLLEKPPSSTSSKHHDSFSETLFDQFRILIEQCDHPQGVRILVDPTSIWAGVCQVLLHHISNEYPTLRTIIIGVSTPYNIQQSDTTIMSEIFASQCYTIPYSPFAHNSGNSTSGALPLLSPSEIKNHAVGMRERRMLNSILFLADLQLEEKCCYIPVVFPLLTEIQSFISTKVPQLINQYQNMIKSVIDDGNSVVANVDKNNAQDNLGLLNPEIQTNLAALSTTLRQQYTSVLYHYLTAPHIAAALFTLFTPLTLSRGGTAGSGTTNSSAAVKNKANTLANTTMVSLQQLINTLRPRNAFPLSTLAHRHDPLLFTKNVLLGASENSKGNGSKSGSFGDLNQSDLPDLSANYSSSFSTTSLFPTLNIPTLGLIPILSNLYPEMHKKQVNYAKKQSQMQNTLQFTNHSSATKSSQSSQTTTTSSSNLNDLYGNEGGEKDDMRLIKLKSTIQIANSFTIGNFDQDRLEDRISNGGDISTSFSTHGLYQSGGGIGASGAYGGSRGNVTSQNPNNSNNTTGVNNHIGNPTTTSTQHHKVIDGVFTSSNQMQYQYECEQRLKGLQRGLYQSFSLTTPSEFYLFSSNFTPLSSVPDLIYTPDALSSMGELSQVFGYSNNVTTGGNGTNNKRATKTSKTLSFLNENNLKLTHSTTHESISTSFLSPQLASSIGTLAGYMKQHDRSQQRSNFYSYIEQDDWLESHNTISNMASEYKDMDIYGVYGEDDDWLNE